MAETSELKPKSFRIDDETSEKLKLIMKDFPNQNLAIQKMVEVYEFQQSKEVVADRKADIDQFEAYVSCLTRLYMTALETAQNQKILAYSTIDSELRQLKEKLDNERQEKDDIALKLKKIFSENEQLKQANEQLSTEYKTRIDDLQDMLKEKEESNQLLKSAGIELKAKVEQMVAEEEQNKELRKELDKLKIEHDKLQTDYKSLESVLSDFKIKHDQEIANIEKTHSEALQRVKEQEQLKLDKELLELEKQHQEQIKQLNERYQSKMWEVLNTKSKSNNQKNKTNTSTTPILQMLDTSTD